jgi:hypothetical protein
MTGLSMIEGDGEPDDAAQPVQLDELCGPCFDDNHDECNSAYCTCPCYEELGEYDGP